MIQKDDHGRTALSASHGIKHKYDIGCYWWPGATSLQANGLLHAPSVAVQTTSVQAVACPANYVYSRGGQMLW
jgi:hypothetical protein